MSCRWQGPADGTMGFSCSRHRDAFASDPFFKFFCDLKVTSSTFQNDASFSLVIINSFNSTPVTILIGF